MLENLKPVEGQGPNELLDKILFLMNSSSEGMRASPPVVQKGSVSPGPKQGNMEQEWRVISGGLRRNHSPEVMQL